MFGIPLQDFNSHSYERLVQKFAGLRNEQEAPYAPSWSRAEKNIFMGG